MHRRPQGAVTEAMLNTWGEVGLAGALGQWSAAWLPLPATPHLEVSHPANLKTMGALLKVPYVQLPPEDLALRDADPDKRQRSCELVAHSWVPPLRIICEVFMTQVGTPLAGCQSRPGFCAVDAPLTRVGVQVHLRDSVPATRFDAVMPNALGVSWGAALGTTAIIMAQTQTYFRQLESVVARWEGASDFSVLQPVVPWPLMPLTITFGTLVKAAGQKEVCLSNTTHCCIHLACKWCDPTHLVLVCAMHIPGRAARSLVWLQDRQGVPRQYVSEQRNGGRDMTY
jgi:hypothetical protein